jgi:ATP-dependent DNA helicase RecQ
VQRGLRGEGFEPEVLAALADAVRAGAAGAGGRAAWVTWVPSSRLGDTIASLAAQVAAALEVPALDLVRRAEQRPPQAEMANAVQQAANVRGAFRVTATPPPGTGVLLDDRRGSGWTLAMVGGQLRRAGAERVVPLVLATAF